MSFGETGVRDLLTGLFTRDYFDEVIGRELERSRRQKTSLSVLSVVVANHDVLRFQAGEDVARAAVVAVAKALQANLKESDLVFRWEEDEFMVVLLDTDTAACGKKANQLAALFRGWREGGSPAQAPVKVRIGSATHREDVTFPAVLQSARAASRNQTQV